MFGTVALGSGAGVLALLATKLRRGREARELDVLRHMAAGASNKRIAQQLAISVTTVATHIRSILRKTGARNRTEATAHARRSNLITTE